MSSEREAFQFPTDPHPLTLRIQRKLFGSDAEFDRYWSNAPAHIGGQSDYAFAAETEPHDPDEIFHQLRWGGQFAYASRHPMLVADAASKFTNRGFKIVHGPGAFRSGFLGLPFLGRQTHYLVARKVQLVLPREFSDRFTYQVALHEPDTKEKNWSVLKEVPTTERVVARLRSKFPDVSEEVVLKKSRKFTEKIFPLFLTREAAMLRILERDLPAAYRGRVPRVIDIQTDDRGMVRKLRMNWLRNGGKPLTHVEFARQAVELLHVLHDTVGVIHLDLRLDNMVITEKGVGFVDFGSAVRVGEDLSKNPLLATLFDELMRTSQIQRMLEKMTLSGSVTSPVISNGLQRVDKSVDFFFLAVQMVDPLLNPDFTGLVSYAAGGDDAAALRRLSEEILRPKNVDNPKYKGAGDILRGIQVLAERLGVPHQANESAATADTASTAIS